MIENNILQNKNLQKLKEIYLVANTPSYLYKNFRQNSAIIAMSQRYDSNFLIELFKTIASSDIKALEEIITLFALLFALSLKDYAEVKDFFKEINKYKLDWISEVQKIIIPNLRVQNTTIVNVNYDTTRVPDFKSLEATTNIFTKNYKPRIDKDSK